MNRVGAARNVAADLLADTRTSLGECPVWDEEGDRLLWVDVDRQRIHALDLATTTVATFDVPVTVSSFALRREGGFVAAAGTAFWTLGDGSDARRLVSLDVSAGVLALNDGKCDPTGRFWSGTAVRDGRTGTAALYRLDADGRLTMALDGITMSNGLGWSPDGRIFYYVDTSTQRIDRFRFDAESGTIADRRVLARISSRDGLPDGLTVDADGYVWLAIWGGGEVRRYAPDGTLERIVRLPVSRVSSCTFGGPERMDLFITTARRGLSEAEQAHEPLAGGIFRYHAETPGLPTVSFAG